ncbi:MAG: XdhC family protein [Chloroflexota bacterium]
MFDAFFSKAHELTEKGEPFATATVVRAEKPTSGKPGDKAIVTLAGVMHGWIGGSCAQPTVIKESLKALSEDEARLIRLSTDPDRQTQREGLLDLPMTCFSGGTLEIYIEPQRPKPRLMIIGNLPVAQALTHLGHAMNYHVIAVDPDSQGASMPHAHQVVTDLERLSELITPLTYVVIATHGHYDELALEKAIKQQAAYIGLVASQRRATSVRNYLSLAGYEENDLAAFKAPAGLDIQARRGDEIALSIMAEIVHRRRNSEELDITILRENLDIEVEEKEIAIDPICHMEVEIQTAKHVYEHNGEAFYFCCPACKRTFSKDPEAFLVN